MATLSDDPELRSIILSNDEDSKKNGLVTLTQPIDEEPFDCGEELGFDTKQMNVLLFQRWRCISGSLRLGVLKVSNISWDISINDIIDLLSENGSAWGSLQIGHEHVHIPIDRTTGKTRADMYVELLTQIDVHRCISRHQGRVVRGRAIILSEANHLELHNAHFCSDGKEILGIDEVESILAICRNYKGHYSRKCAERPFEHVASLLRLAPWERLSQLECDRLYYLSCEAIEALLEHIRLGCGTPRLTAVYGASERGMQTGLIEGTPRPLDRLRNAINDFSPFTELKKKHVEQIICTFRKG
jgi:hypothetical protein